MVFCRIEETGEERAQVIVLASDSRIRERVSDLKFNEGTNSEGGPMIFGKNPTRALCSRFCHNKESLGDILLRGEKKDKGSVPSSNFDWTTITRDREEEKQPSVRDTGVLKKTGRSTVSEFEKGCPRWFQGKK